MLLSQEHSAKSPFEQALVTDHASAAEFIACMYAVSLLSINFVQKLNSILFWKWKSGKVEKIITY